MIVKKENLAKFVAKSKEFNTGMPVLGFNFHYGDNLQPNDFVVLVLPDDWVLTCWDNRKVYGPLCAFLQRAINEKRSIYVQPAAKNPFFRPFFGEGDIEWVQTSKGYATQEHIDSLEMSVDDFFTEEWVEFTTPSEDVEPPVTEKKTRKRS